MIDSKSWNLIQNHGKSMEFHSKSLRIYLKQFKMMEDPLKSIQNHGKSIDFHSN